MGWSAQEAGYGIGDEGVVGMMMREWLEKGMREEIFPGFREKVALAEELLTSKEKGEGVLVGLMDKELYVAVVLVGMAKGLGVFLGNGLWREREWGQVDEIFRREILSEGLWGIEGKGEDFERYGGYLMIATGGTGGKLKFAVHGRESMEASVRQMREYFGEWERMNWWDVLPVYHVSGWMPVVRALMSGGQVEFWDWRRIGEIKDVEVKKGWYTSLVPTQLRMVMGDEELIGWFRGFKRIFIGGAGCEEGLIEESRKVGLNVVCTYGMTETCSMVMVKEGGIYKELPGVGIKKGERGNVVIEAGSVFYGYYPEEVKQVREWETNDEMVEDGNGNIIGVKRVDLIINSGGAKVDPEEVKEVVRRNLNGGEVEVRGIKDFKWGEVVGVIYTGEVKNGDVKKMVEEVGGDLVYYKVPRRWIRVKRMPYDGKGKWDWELMKELTIETWNSDEEA